MAYRVTGDGKYVRELVAQLRSWGDQNPVPADPDAWASAGPAWSLLTAADRATHWVYAYTMVLGSADWTPAANTLFLAKLWEHGDYLSRVTSSGFRQMVAPNGQYSGVSDTYRGSDPGPFLVTAHFSSGPD